MLKEESRSGAHATDALMAVRRAAHSLRGGRQDYTPIIDVVGSACFDHFGEDTQAYGYAAAFGLSKTCEDAVTKQLIDLMQRADHYALPDGREKTDEFFFAEQNARLVRNAEEYYRTMFRGRVSSWNLRDSHMAETLQSLDRHLTAGGAPPRIAVWAHNSPLRGASATGVGDLGEWNVGQLARGRR